MISKRSAVNWPEPAREQSNQGQLGSQEDENEICASRPEQQQQSSPSSARLVPAGQDCRPAAANLGIDFRGSAVELPLTNNRYSRFLFSGLDDLHCKRTDSDVAQPMDYSSVSLGSLRDTGAAHLHVPHAYLYLRHLDRLLSQLKMHNGAVMLSEALQRNAEHEARLSNISVPSQ